MNGQTMMAVFHALLMFTHHYYVVRGQLYSWLTFSTCN